MRLLVVVAWVLSLALASVLVVPSARADHNTVPWSPYASVVGGTGTLTNRTPGVVADASGNVYVFYYQQAPGSAYNVFVMKYQDQGTSGALTPVAGFPVQVNSAVNTVYGAAYGIWSPHAAVDHEGTVYVTWFSSTISVFVSKSTDGGSTWSPQVMVNPASFSGFAFAPSIAVAPNGRVYVAWADEKSGAFNVTVAYSTDGGATFVGATNVSETKPGMSWPSVAGIGVDSHNRVHVVFTQYTGGGGTPSWINYTYSDDGATWSSPVTLNGGPIEGNNPQIAIDARDGLHVVWIDGRTGSSGNPLVYARTSTDRGATWSPELPISEGVSAPYINYYLSLVRVAVQGDTLLVVWDGVFGGNAMSSVVSADDGATWYPEQVHSTDGQGVSLSVDGNGTFYAFSTDTGTTPLSVGVTWWHSPPSHVTGTTVSAGTGSLTVTWTAPPENDVVAYQVWRSSDGSTYTFAGTVSAPSTSLEDTGLANGTYWYQVTALDTYGYASHPSPSVSGVVGVTVEQLQSAIAVLQGQLGTANANLAAIQSQLNALRNQVNQLQGNTSALQKQIADLQNQLNTLQSQQATQTISYANLAFEIIVVVLLVVLLLNQMRRPKAPQMMMAQPGQAEPPRHPEDEL